MKAPLPLHPEAPDKVHVPAITFPVTVPCSFRTLGVVSVVLTVIPNVPLTLPLKFPARAKLPVSVVFCDAKQELDEVKEKFVTSKVPLLVSVKFVVNPKAGVPSGLVSFAVHVPLILPEFGPLPHPAMINAINKIAPTYNRFFKISSLELAVMSWDFRETKRPLPLSV